MPPSCRVRCCCPAAGSLLRQYFAVLGSSVLPGRGLLLPGEFLCPLLSDGVRGEPWGSISASHPCPPTIAPPLLSSCLPHLISSPPSLSHSSPPRAHLTPSHCPSSFQLPPSSGSPPLLHGTVGHGWAGQMGILMGCWVPWGVCAPGRCSGCSAPLSPLLAGVELHK